MKPALFLWIINYPHIVFSHTLSSNYTICCYILTYLIFPLIAFSPILSLNSVTVSLSIHVADVNTDSVMIAVLC